MSFKAVLIVIGIVALGVLITFGVEEIRFGVISRALVTEVCYEIEGHWMLNNVYDPLVKFKAGSASEIKSCLATSWDISGKTLTFTIRVG